jgi:restriction system protein
MIKRIFTAGNYVSRRRNSLAEDIIDIAAHLPWWVGVLFASISYLILHQVADVQFKGSVTPGQMGTAVVQNLWRTLAFFGQLVLPALFLIGAFVSFIKQKRRNKLYKSMEYETEPAGSELRSVSHKEILNEMSWAEFEQLIAEFFKRNGFTVHEIPPGPDGGVDLVLSKNCKKFIVQCKHWKNFKVNVQIIREQFGIMHAVEAYGAYVVTSGIFTDDAIQFAEGKNIVLIDGANLKKIIRKTKTLIEEKNTPRIAISSPYCPVCGALMTRRKAKRGIWEGQEFWGCSQFPKCKGTQSI